MKNVAFGLSLVVAFVATSTVGCAQPADTETGEPFASVDDDVATKGPPPGCPAVVAMTVDSTSAGGGAVDPNDPCDYWVVEKTLSDDNVKIEVSMLPTLAQQGITVAGAAQCTASYIVSEAWGKRGAYYTYERDGTPVFHKGGNWEFLGEKTIYGHWSGSGSCTFPDAQLRCAIGSATVPCRIPVFNDPSSYDYRPYTKVRVAMKNRVYAANGVVSVAPSASFQQIP